VILLDVRLGNGYRVVEVTNFIKKCSLRSSEIHLRFPGWVRCDTSL